MPGLLLINSSEFLHSGKFSAPLYSINTIPSAPTVTNGERCRPGTVTLQASGGTNGQYRWYDAETGGAAFNGEVNNNFTSPSITSTATYYVSVNNGCESLRTSVTAEIKPLPAAPSVSNESRCGTGSITLTASGGTDGQYRWYTEVTGGNPLPGEVNHNLVISTLASTTSYYVSVSGQCESVRSQINATVFTPPAKPSITSSISPNNNVISICTEPLTLSAPSGFTTYLWSNGATTQSIIINAPLNGLSIVVTDGNGCSSSSSDSFDIITQASCINNAPTISAINSTTTLEGSLTVNLLSLISDPDNNLNPSSLRITVQPTSGAVASIDTNGNLVIDYKGILFSGRDRIGIEACDHSGACTRQELTIDVIGDVVVYNGVSPNGDGKNDFLFLQYIELLEETKNNKVSIFNRWGDRVFEASNYDNRTTVFTGQNKNGNDLPSGNYFYKIDFVSGKKTMTGFFFLSGKFLKNSFVDCLNKTWPFINKAGVDLNKICSGF